ncbi:hypothetical protein NFJ02_06g128760 [Pycnococcus provasolii]
MRSLISPQLTKCAMTSSAIAGGPTCCIPGDSVLVALALDMRRRRCHTRVQDNHQTTKQGVPFIVIRRALPSSSRARVLSPAREKRTNATSQVRIQRGVADERVTSGAVDNEAMPREARAPPRRHDAARWPKQ